MAFGDDDLDEFVRDGVSVTFDGAAPDLQGWLDAPGAFVLADQGRAPVNATDRAVLLRTDQLGTLAQGSTIVVDGVPYTVREMQPIDDGAFSVISLR